MQITGFKIPISDIQRSANFYKEHLGFSIAFQSEEYGWVSIEKGSVDIGLYVPGKGGGNRALGGSVDFSLSIADFEQTHSVLREKGVEVSEIKDTDDGMQVFSITDPDQNKLIICKE